MVKLLSAIGFVAGLCLFASCKKSQDYGATALQKMSNGWWVVASSTDSGVLARSASALNHIFFVTYNTSENTNNALWVDDLQYIGSGYDVKSTLTASLAGFTLTGASGTENLYQSGNAIKWASGKIFVKGGISRSGVATDSLFLQVIFAANPADTLTIKGVARTGFDADDYPAMPYTPGP